MKTKIHAIPRIINLAIGLIAFGAIFSACQKKDISSDLSAPDTKVDPVAKIDPVALQRLEKAIAAYQKIIISFNASGITMEEFRTQTNEADFLFRDAIKFFKAKGIKEDIIGGEDLTLLAEKLADYREIYQIAVANETHLKNGFLRSGIIYDPIKKPSQFYATYAPSAPSDHESKRWSFIEDSTPLVIWGLGDFLDLARKLPEIKLYTADSASRSDKYTLLPANITKELLSYQHGTQEPKEFFTHFEKYIKESKYGFKLEHQSRDNYDYYFFELYVYWPDVKLFAISDMNRIVEKLDLEVKKLQ